MSKRRLDLPRRDRRIVRFRNRPPDHQHAGACIARSARRYDPFLVAHRAARGAQAGDDEEALLPALVHFAHLVAGADNSVEPRILRQIGEAQHLVVLAAHLQLEGAQLLLFVHLEAAAEAVDRLLPAPAAEGPESGDGGGSGPDSRGARR